MAPSLRSDSVPELSTIEEKLDFTLPVLHEDESVCRLSKRRLKILKDKGIHIKKGRWTQKETSVLVNNYQEFTEKFGIDDPVLIFGIGKNSAEILPFLKAKHFYARLGKGLNDRPLASIYSKARVLLNPLRRNRDKFSKAEVSKLIKLRERGLGWPEIEKIMKKSAASCSAAYAWHKKKVNGGKWSKEEEQQLVKAVKKIVGPIKSVKKRSNIPWFKIAELMPTRNSTQCRHYWELHLSWTCDASQRKKWTTHNLAMLINILKNEYCVEDETDVDWKKIQEFFTQYSPSYNYLRKRWYRLRSRAPKGKEFREVIDFYYKKYKAIIESFNNINQSN
ncbi:cyclin-D-binding Myb-like transcription factor 1 [Stegodyphus dumicola]|uniref:cyclin-D-binding Myb-like transcription factor 1 n=1 Tax=Stegodyphus dumicola TaxID=202533 RepID=UPI0015AECD22|nr:cyclin-D-binding Myb-like transcription factor 1 [Stegodyphus dumicola]